MNRAAPIVPALGEAAGHAETAYREITLMALCYDAAGFDVTEKVAATIEDVGDIASWASRPGPIAMAEAELPYTFAAPVAAEWRARRRWPAPRSAA